MQIVPLIDAVMGNNIIRKYFTVDTQSGGKTKIKGGSRGGGGVAFLAILKLRRTVGHNLGKYSNEVNKY